MITDLAYGHALCKLRARCLDALLRKPCPRTFITALALFAVATGAQAQNVFVAEAANNAVGIFDADTFAYNGSLGDGLLNVPSGIAAARTEVFGADRPASTSSTPKAETCRTCSAMASLQAPPPSP